MVHRVDLMTRLIKDPRVDASYGEESEVLLKGAGKMGGAYIVRMAAGNSEEYIPKEELWPHVRECVPTLTAPRTFISPSLG